MSKNIFNRGESPKSKNLNCKKGKGRKAVFERPRIAAATSAFRYTCVSLGLKIARVFTTLLGVAIDASTNTCET